MDSKFNRVFNLAYPHIKEFEGFIASPYFCVAGHLTCGIGNLIEDNVMYGGVKGSDIRKYASTLTGSISSKNNKLRVKYKDLISESEARELCKDKCVYFFNEIDKLVVVDLEDNQFASILSLVYNIGVGNFKSSTLKVRINTRDNSGIRHEFSRWIFAGGVKLNGLIKRREIETKLFFNELLI